MTIPFSADEANFYASEYIKRKETPNNQGFFTTYFDVVGLDENKGVFTPFAERLFPRPFYVGNESDARNETLIIEVLDSNYLHKDYDSLNIISKDNYIKSISPNPVITTTEIKYKVKNGNSAYISISPVSGMGSVNNYVLDLNDHDLIIDLSNLSSGYYVVSLFVDNVLKDSEIISK